ncbi:vomeronasal type-2 receptor 26 [Xenopus tropicalis]|uniref:Vomeronasal type-2 receptor 26 n=1 Tax=Xenopus tropicalis TaxID=8364 RepID=A0A8J1JBW9_XENTR|nr:vomeronasal type-2 receptor 26 [Xenopus tropicalis]
MNRRKSVHGGAFECVLPGSQSARMARFATEYYYSMQALIFAIKEINADPALLPNVTLGFQVFDTCLALRKAIQATLQMMSGRGEITPNYHCRKESPLAGIIGDSESTGSILMAQILGLNRFPQISYFATNPMLSDRGLFPSFLRTIPSDEFQMKGLAQLVLHFGWSWVGLLASDNDYDAVECHPCSWDTWPDPNRIKCVPKTTEFLFYEGPLGYGLTSTAMISSPVPLFILGIFICYKKTPIVRANNYSLSCLLLLSLFLCFLCSLGFIGYPQPEKCLLRQVAFGMVFALCISCVLAKTITVVIAFNATKPGNRLRKWTGVRVSYCVIGICVLIQLFLCVIWLILSPPFPEYDTGTKPGIIIVVCNEGSPTAFWCMLGYLGFLAMISFIVAFLARRLPDSFNEAKLITFSMLAFLSVWVSFIPAYLSARGMYTVAMEVFAILSSSWAVVGCIFVPKCYIVLFKPNVNSRKHILGKRGPM